MNLTIVPKKLSGAVTPPPSKSQAHRLIIAAALADVQVDLVIGDHGTKGFGHATHLDSILQILHPFSARTGRQRR